MSQPSDDGTRQERTVDVVVMGSGGGGLLAALTVARAGGSVVLVEKASTIGGTTAVSGGVIWVPCNHRMAEAGVSDSRDAALTYMKRIADGRAPDELIERYLDAAPEMVRYVEAETEIQFTAMPSYPDYHPEFPGGVTGGRSLDNGLFDTTTLGAWQPKLRKNPITGRMPISIPEAMGWGVFWNPFGAPYQEVSARAKAGIVHGGAGLCGKLLKALLAAGVEPLLETPGEHLVVEDGRVVGLDVRHEGAPLRLRARKGVILASGGFEWNETYRKAFLPLELTHPVSPPQNTGDGLRMAMSVGAELGNMGEAWWTPAVALPGETYDGAPLYRSEFSVRCLPHSILVNRRGQRFTNESHNYNDMTKPYFHHDPVAYDRPNVPAWLMVDQQYLDKYVLITAVKGRPLPDWLIVADSLAELAEKTSVDPAGLAATVERFNGFARAGVDPDFRRGESAFDQFYGDPRQREQGGSPSLGTLEKAPFYAVQLHPGAMGTKGGPKTDVDGRVLHAEGGVVDGLYAVGNAAASVAGPGYPGAGMTIGASMTFGYLAAKHAMLRA